MKKTTKKLPASVKIVITSVKVQFDVQELGNFMTINLEEERVG